MPETARLTRGQSKLANLVLTLCVFANTWDWGISGSTILIRFTGSTALAQPADKSQLRAKIKSAAEKLNDIANSAPDMIRAMFAGNTPSTSLLALDEKSTAAEAELEGAVLAAQKSGALSDNETKELARLGDLAKKAYGPVKEDIETLKSVPDLPIVGRDAAVRLAPKKQQVEVINNAEAAKKAVGELVAAIRKLP
jgi:hypothetical protein